MLMPRGKQLHQVYVWSMTPVQDKNMALSKDSRHAKQDQADMLAKSTYQLLMPRYACFVGMHGNDCRPSAFDSSRRFLWASPKSSLCMTKDDYVEGNGVGVGCVAPFIHTMSAV
jgi:hypothetical protein